jgi:3-oxoadipate enol-lactonase
MCSRPLVTEAPVVPAGQSSIMEPAEGVVPGTGLPYLHAGTGQAIVLLHGLGAFKEIWWTTIRALAPTHHAIAFDWPGHNHAPFEAPQVPAGQLLEMLVRLTVESCAALGLERITLAGHSLGGNVAARVALAYPDLVERLVLVDAAIDNAYYPRMSRLLVLPRFGQAVIRLKQQIGRPMITLGASVPHDHRGGVLRPWARRLRYDALAEPQIQYLYLAAVHGGSLLDQVRDIHQPTLVITGARDPVVRPRLARELASRIPNAELQIIRGAYHAPMDERPAEFRRALLSFLERN